MTDDVPEYPRSPRPVRGTAGLRGFIMQADNLVLLRMGCGGMVRNERCRPQVLLPQ
jgi:hypothetical protein